MAVLKPGIIVMDGAGQMAVDPTVMESFRQIPGVMRWRRTRSGLRPKRPGWKCRDLRQGGSLPFDPYTRTQQVKRAQTKHPQGLAQPKRLAKIAAGSLAVKTNPDPRCQVFPHHDCHVQDRRIILAASAGRLPRCFAPQPRLPEPETGLAGCFAPQPHGRSVQWGWY